MSEVGARRQRRGGRLFPLLLLWLGSLPGLVRPAAAQDMARVRATIGTLTAPALHGRGYVQRGDQLAATFLAHRFRALGLQPLAPGFIQHFPLDVNTFPGALALTAGTTTLRPGYDFIADPASGGGTVSGAAVPLDTLIFTDEAARQRLLQQPLRGQVLVLRQSDEARLPTLPPPLQQYLDQAAARLTLVPRKLTASLAPAQVAQPRLEVLASAWPAGTTTVRLQVEARLLHDYQSQNIVGMVRGTARPDSFLVVTAHYDHLGQMGRGAYFPGANDNASGTAMLLELAAYYAQPAHRPACSLVFIAFGGEEAGLLGSAYFVQHPLVPLPAIRFLINLDLLGTGDEGLTVVNGRLFPAAFRQLQRLNAAGHFVPAIAARGPAANSDHYYFTEHGVPAFFLYTRGGIAAYHDVYDQAATLPLTAFPGVFHLLTGFLESLISAG